MAEPEEVIHLEGLDPGSTMAETEEISSNLYIARASTPPSIQSLGGKGAPTLPINCMIDNLSATDWVIRQHR